jgi:FkbM family methyltransferase
MPDETGRLDMSHVKSRHVAPWHGVDVTFCDWNHPLVHEQPISELLHRYGEIYHWDKLIAPGSVCVDVGAHCGDTTVPMGVFAFDHARQKRGKVIAVEPNKDVFPVLQTNTELNAHWCDFVLSTNAITKKDGEMVELLDHGNENCNGGLLDANFSPALQEQIASAAKTTTLVEGIRLESLCKNLLTSDELSRLSFIKTDCEGYDKEILRSAKDFLTEYKPYMFVEWYDVFPAMEDHYDFFAAIAEIGYEAYNPQTLRPAEPGVKLADLLLVHADRRQRIAEL